MTHIWDFFFRGTLGPPYVEILRFECYLNTRLHFKIWRHVVFLNWKFFSKLCYKQEMRRSHLPNKMISFQTQKHAILNYTSDKTHFLGCCCLSGIAIFAKRVTWNYACSPFKFMPKCHMFPKGDGRVGMFNVGGACSHFWFKSSHFFGCTSN